jgi:Na+-transporting methylmalonyl-CoA/oxaloacetate decarboxylase gamma subunit
MMTIAKISWDFSNVGVQGWTIFVIGWLVVFCALMLLSSVFNIMPKIMALGSKRKEKKQVRLEEKTKTSQGEDGVITGELTAAIGFALHMYFNEMHDDENRILTVVHKSRKYSPWNSKIYNVMNYKH